MEVINKSKRTTISRDTKVASSFSDKFLGLLKKSNPRSLLIKTRFGIHTFGLKSLIDVVVLDNNYEVVKLGLAIKPNRFFFWNPKFSCVLELPEFSIKNSKTEIGDKLELVHRRNDIERSLK